MVKSLDEQIKSLQETHVPSKLRIPRLQEVKFF